MSAPPILARPSAALGQPQGAVSGFKVVVLDANGRPIGGAAVEVAPRGGPARLASTGSDGISRVAFDRDVPADAPVDITAVYGDYAVRREHRASEGALGVFVQLPVCLAQPFITTAEAIALGLGAAVTVAGFVWKQEAAKLGGEILAGAAIFTIVFRHSCPGP